MIKKGFQFVYFLYFAVLFAGIIILSFPFTLFFLALPKKISDPAMFYLMKGGSYLLFILSGMMPKNFHRGKTDFSKSYIIIPTHQSYIEAATIYTSIPVVFKTLGKKELEKTPLYGLIYKAVCITVDRSSLQARALSFRKMKQELEQGVCITIFPEGTFPDHPQDQLLPFKDGCFTLAVMQQTDLLPVLYPDSALRMHPSKITYMTPGANRAIFLPVITVASLQKKDTEQLKKYTREYMQSCYDHYLKNDAESVWDFAMAFQKNNPIKPV